MYERVCVCVCVCMPDHVLYYHVRVRIYYIVPYCMRVPPVAQLDVRVRNLKFRTILDYGGPNGAHTRAYIHTHTHIRTKAAVLGYGNINVLFATTTKTVSSHRARARVCVCVCLCVLCTE